jgi:hypothetical protein
MPRIDRGVIVAVVLEVSAEYLVTGKAPAGITAAALEIAMAADKLDAEGKRVALNQVEGLLFSCGVGLGFNPFITAAERGPQVRRGSKPSPRINVFTCTISK